MTKTRIEWIDFVKAVAILTVLYIHATDGIYIIFSEAFLDYPFVSRMFHFSSLFIGRIGVPFFLMVTGYLLLDRSYDDQKVRHFWENNCKNLIIITVIWSVIYTIVLQVATFNSPDIDTVDMGNLFFSHMWYMPMIIGMYLSIPFVSSALKHFDKKTILYAVGVFSILAFLVPFLTTFLDINGIQNVSIQYSLGFSGGVYGIYIVLGYLVKKGTFKNISSYIFALIAIVSFLISVIFQEYAFSKGYPFVLWYEFPFILFGSFALFELFSRIKHIRGYSVIKFFAKYSFAVFLIHNIFRIPLLAIVIDLPVSDPIKSIILWILLIIFSFIAAVIVYRIPKIGKYILYMR